MESPGYRGYRLPIDDRGYRLKKVFEQLICPWVEGLRIVVERHHSQEI